MKSLEKNEKIHLFGKLSKGTSYEDYALQNKILDKNNDFIEKKKGSAKFSFAFVYDNEIFGVWFDYQERENLRFPRLLQKHTLFIFFYSKRPFA